VRVQRYSDDPKKTLRVSVGVNGSSEAS
jgi:hypothetical protein